MRAHARHMWICAAMVVVALVVVLATGSAAALLPALGCVAMMIVMMGAMALGHSRTHRS